MRATDPAASAAAQNARTDATVRRIHLSDLADEAILKLVWRREVRPALRAMKFRNANLVPDPIAYAAYEWGLDTLVSELANDIRLGRYSPEKGEIIRMAKGKGLSRPLCYLTPRDALVYRTITWIVMDQLLAQAREWVGVNIGDKGAVPEEADLAADSFDWFRFWLARQGHIDRMIDDPDVNFIVESDIANFFPSIRLEAVREHLHSQTSLDKEVVRLCVQIVDGVMPRRDYSQVSLMGLPQEMIGSSRDLAHSLLFDVDQEFDAEGQAGRYSRYMDDVLLGVKSREQGEFCISRLQRGLESIGLYPNAAKTTVITVDEFITQSMVSANGDIDRLDKELGITTAGSPKTVSPAPEAVAGIEEISLRHRSLNPRPKRWSRVTRRIYTLHRRAGIKSWWPHWQSDIIDDPGSAGQILEYVRSWPLLPETVLALSQLSSQYSGLYTDISLLAAETVSSSPVGHDEDIWSLCYTTSRQEMNRLVSLGSSNPERDRIASAWLVAAWKFANEAQKRSLLADLPRVADRVSPIRVQALPLLVAAGDSLSEWVAAKPGLAWENAMAAEYLRSLEQGEERAVGIALSLLDPVPRLAPPRFAILPRAVPLIDIVGRSGSDKLTQAAPRIMKKLERNPERLRDKRLELIISRWCL